jgi:Ca2+-binding EF-hand superfamily protein
MSKNNDIAGLQREFASFDRDGNGRLEYAEFVELLGTVGPRPTEEEAQLAFSVIDTDHTGYVEFEEFVHWWLDH